MSSARRFGPPADETCDVRVDVTRGGPPSTSNGVSKHARIPAARLAEGTDRGSRYAYALPTRRGTVVRPPALWEGVAAQYGDHFQRSGRGDNGRSEAGDSGRGWVTSAGDLNGQNKTRRRRVAVGLRLKPDAFGADG